MNKEFVNLEFVGADGSVLRSFEYPITETRFKLSLLATLPSISSRSKWTLLNDFDDRFCGDSLTYDFMQKIHYVCGFSKLPYLNEFYFTKIMPKDNVLLTFEKWPDAEYIVSNVDRFSMNTYMCPLLFADLAKYNHDEEFLTGMKLFMFHKKVVETSIAFSSLLLSPYIVFWILDFLNKEYFNEWNMIKFIGSTNRSIEKAKK